eukprot:m.193507 g.193507  ORF g.193507 m.193507 type:complete len:1160 (+) comp32504_c0_seq2:194-3673(+)
MDVDTMDLDEPSSSTTSFATDNSCVITKANLTLPSLSHPLAPMFLVVSTGAVSELASASTEQLRMFLPAVFLMMKSYEDVQFEHEINDADALAYSVVASAFETIPGIDTLEELAELNVADVVIHAQRLRPAEATEATPEQFEQASVLQRVELVVSEVRRLLVQPTPTETETETVSVSVAATSALFSAQSHLDDIVWVLHTVARKLKTTLTVEDIVKALIFTEEGLTLVFRVVMTAPLSFRRVAIAVASLWKVHSETLWKVKRCEDVLLELCKLAPFMVSFVRDLLLEEKCMARVVMTLTLEYLQDAAAFFCGAIHQPQNLIWLQSFLESADENTLSHLMHYLNPAHTPKENHSEICGLLKTNCILFRRPNATLESSSRCAQESQYLAHFLSSNTSSDKFGTRLVELSLCTLICCRHVSGPTLYPEMVKWVESLVANTQAYARESFGETLLLLAVHFSRDNIKDVADLVRSTLGLEFDVPVDCLKRICEMFVAKVFPEQVLVEKVLTLKVTEGLHHGHGGFVPVHAVYHVLNSRLFVKYNVQPREWIYSQIENVATDKRVFGMLQELLMSLADFNSNPQGTSLSGNAHPPRTEDLEKLRVPLEKIPESQIVKLLAKDTSFTVAKVLMLYYMSCFNQALVVAREDKQLSKEQTLNVQAVKPYSMELLQQLPVLRLLREAENNGDVYADIYPALLSMVIESFPELFGISELLRNEGVLDNLDDDEHLVDGGSNSETAFGPLLANSTQYYHAQPSTSSPSLGGVDSRLLLFSLLDVQQRPTEALAVIESAKNLSDVELVGCMTDILDVVLVPMVEGYVDRRIGHQFGMLWHRLSGLAPHELWTETLKRLQPRSNWSNLEHAKLLEDPLLILRCHKKALRNRCVLEIVLSVLEAYLNIPKVQQIKATATPQDTLAKDWQVYLKDSSGVTSVVVPGTTRAVSETIVLLQNAAVVQMLLELCLESTYHDGTNGSRYTSEDQFYDYTVGDLQETRIQICKFVHEMFLESVALIRIVHFQGYDASLLQMLSFGVPSMHLCMDFIEQLLVHSSLEKQIFSVQIAGVLAPRFTVEKMLEIARRIVGKLQDLANADSQTRMAFFAPTFDSIVSLCEAFPKLSESVVALLLKLQEIQRAHNAVNNTAHSTFDNQVLQAFEAVVGNVLKKTSL